MNPWSERDHRLTGRIRVRAGMESDGWFSAHRVCIAQVEESYVYYPVIGPDDAATNKKRWRDMRVSDLPLSVLTATNREP